MKELSIEEKAKAYDEAYKVAESIHRFSSNLAEIKRMEDMFPELKESEDERIKKTLIDFFSEGANNDEFTNNIPDIEILAWLEKQGDKDKFIEKELGCIKGYRENAIKRLEELEKQGEQKPVNDTDEDIVEAVKDTSILDWVEPKFHEGEWVVQKGLGKYKIVEVCESWYEVISYNDGIQYSIGFDKENDCHLWTIQDAKDGDVLVEDSCIFIIQKLGDNSTAAKTYCTLYNDGDFDDGSILYFDIDSTKPATKEQRDTLMKAMADAGWEFDFEKKELKKIEQKLAWSEGDEKHIDSLLERLEGMCKKGATFTKTRFAISQDMDWLKSLKERIGG